MVTTMTLLTSTQYHCHKCPQICCVCRNLNPGFSSFMTCHQVCYKNHTTGVSRGTGMPTLPEHQSSPLDFSGLCVAQSLVLCVVFCRSLSFFCLFLITPLPVKNAEITCSDYCFSNA